MNLEYDQDSRQQERDQQAIMDRFNEMGNPLMQIPGTDRFIRSGQLFEAKTVKGNTNIIVTLENPKDKSGKWIYYAHGERLKKIEAEVFLKAVEWGDLMPRLAQEIDTGRLAMAVIALDAFANRRSVSEQIDSIAEQAVERTRGGVV